MRTCSVKHQAGLASVMLVAFILPIFYALFTFTSDVGNYYTYRRNAQRAIDGAVVFGEKYLPYTDAAQSAIESYLGAYPFIQDGILTVEATPQGVSIVFEHDFQPTFPRLLGLTDAAIPVYIESESFSAPLDAYIVLDTSAYLSPDLNSDTPWHDNIGQQVAESIEHIFPEFSTEDGIPNPTPTPYDSKVIAEQCQNEVFRPMKQAAITSYEYLSAFSLNKVGVGFYPLISTRGTEGVLRGAASEIAVQGDETNAVFVDDRNRYVRNVHCAQLAEAEVVISGQEYFRFPDARVNAAGVFKATGASTSMLNAAGEYDTSYDEFLTVRQVIWSRPTASIEFYRLTPEIGDMLTNLYSGLAQAADTNEGNNVVGRGSLQGQANKLGIIFAGDLPWANGSRLVATNGAINSDVLNVVRNTLLRHRDEFQAYPSRTSLLYVVHRFNFDSGILPNGNSVQFDAGVAALRELFNEISTEQFELHLIAESSPGAVRDRVTAYITKENRVGILSSSRPTK